MASYDSDSSDGEFTETGVLLGYASREADEDVINRLGGQPDWLDPEHPPSAAFARCKVCKDLMVMLLQLNGELPERFPDHERRIYVFACRRASCRRRDGSVRALRSMRAWKGDAEEKNKKEELVSKVDAPKDESKKENSGPGLGDALFGGKATGGGSSMANPFSSNANPFSSTTSGGGTGGANPFSSSSSSTPPVAAEKPKPKPKPTEQSQAELSKTFAETLSLNAPPKEPPPPAEPWPETSAQPQPYPVLYLSEADFETLDPTPNKVPTNARMEDADAPEPSALDREAFESGMDAAFQKFADRMAQNPDQVIRYEFGGTPLLYSKTDAVGAALSAQERNGGGMPGCGNCGARRTFEVQLTPNAIAELEADDMGLEGMEWGTIIVGVCEGDCVPLGTETGEVGYKEEWVGVQWEELSKGN